MDELRSWALGTLPLHTVLVVSIVVARARRPSSPHAVRAAGVVTAGLIAVGLQGAHFLEELSAGLPALVPPMVGLAPWSESAFMAYNGAWFLVWGGCLAALATGRRAPLWPLWFLSLAQLLNLVAHAALSVGAGRYVPGLATAPLVAAAGLFLGHRLLRASSAPPASG